MAESSTPPRKIQNLRSFTVQIRHIKTQAIVGTGFVVSEDGLIATCAHVVVAAGVNPRFGKIPGHWDLIRQSFFPSSEALQTGNTATLPVYFPQARRLPSAERTRDATVVGCFSDSDDDLVLLKLVGETLPEGVEVALVDRADESVNVADERRFRSYGYRRLDKYQGLQADGFILGTVEPPSNRAVLLDPLQLRSPEIDSGMSGAAVLDVVRDRVAAKSALTCAHRVNNEKERRKIVRDSLIDQGWADHLQGNFDLAQKSFQQAEQLEQQIDLDKQYLDNLRGIRHADHLRCQGNIDYARRIAEANQIICEQNCLQNDLSRCHRQLGDLDATANLHKAHAHYDEALYIAHSISKQGVLIEALLARGRWAARRGEGAAAASDLEEALGYAVEGGYRIYEADIRVALAWMHQAQGNLGAAQREAERAQRMSEQMGYYWGKKDAAEVLAELAHSREVV